MALRQILQSPFSRLSPLLLQELARASRRISDAAGTRSTSELIEEATLRTPPNFLGQGQAGGTPGAPVDPLAAFRRRVFALLQREAQGRGNP